MIYCLTGELILLDALTYTAVIDCMGVGYKALITANTLSKLNQTNPEKVRLYTHMQVREDGVELFGFYDTDELEAFRLLISVSGVGPKGAMAILSVMTPTALSIAIASEDSKTISRAQGIGGKTAARVVLELKDKFAKAFPVPEGTIQVEMPSKKSASSPKNSSRLSDARDALVVLGYTQNEAVSALKGVDASKSTEDMIREALTNLMKQ